MLTRHQQSILNNQLRLAIQSDNFEQVVTLVNTGAEVNAEYEDDFNDKPIHYACSNEGINSLKIVKFLLEHGADIDDKGAQYPPIHIASNLSNLKLVKLLINKGADINIIGLGNVNALHLAAEVGAKAVCNYLIEQGIDSSLENDEGYTGAQMMRINNNSNRTGRNI